MVFTSQTYYSESVESSHTFCCGSGKLTRVVAIKDRNELHLNFQLPPLTMHNTAFQVSTEGLLTVPQCG